MIRRTSILKRLVALFSVMHDVPSLTAFTSPPIISCSSTLTPSTISHKLSTCLYSTSQINLNESQPVENEDLPSMSNESNGPLNTIHLVSIPPLSDEAPRVVRDVWKWKDIVLGDGRDYFIPRPRALKALSSIIVGTSFQEYTVTECAILSNCARLDVLLSLERVMKAGDKDGVPFDADNGEIGDDGKIHVTADEAAKMIVGNYIILQLETFQSKRSSPLMESVSSFLDLPGMVYEEDKAVSHKNQISYRNDQSQLLVSLLTGTSKIDEVVRHFSKVAAGMAPRASRPDRPVLFRPFSSRDAHIMLQLKRTAEVASQYPRMKIILDAALNAGKAARDTTQCPVLNKLKGYDGEGKYSQAAPLQLAKEVSEEVAELAIEPSVQRSIERLNAFNFSDKIVLLRQRATNLYDPNDRDCDKLVKQILHEPCKELRQGEDVDITQVLELIQVKLKEM